MDENTPQNNLQPTMPGHVTQTSPGAGGRGIKSVMVVNKALSVPMQDLSEDKLLMDCAHAEVDGRQVPRLGKIPLLARLGTGGMSAVYYGIHPNLRVEVAVKVLPLSMAQKDPVLIERFFREAQTAAAVRSPHLVHVSDVDEDRGLFYIVMEYVTGISAAQLIKQAAAKGVTGVPEADALEIAIAATKGLNAAHTEGIVHRDVKPANIMLPSKRDAEGVEYAQAKLADLGLARSEGGEGLTTSFQVMGTPGYMAPEQVQDAKSAGKPADVWGMGATLYALLCGRAPFSGRTSMEVLMYTVEHPHAPLTKARGDIRLEIEAVVDKCLAKDPAKRYPSASELLEALLALKPSRQPPAPKAEAPKLRSAVIKTVIMSKKASARVAITLQPSPPNSSKDLPPTQTKASASSERLPTTALTPSGGTMPVEWKHRVYEAWPFKDDEAMRRVRETAQATGLPEKKTIGLPAEVSIPLVLLPAAKFVMGSPHQEEGHEKDELTHYVTLTRPIFIGMAPVTQEQYLAVTGTNPSRFKDESDSPRRPVERVSWKDLHEKFLPLMQTFAPQGWFFRLPTEAEWEYACRAGTDTPYSFGDKLTNRQALFKWDAANRKGGTWIFRKPTSSRFLSLKPGDSWSETLEVGTYPPNAFGLHDMHGNVWEWCEDSYHPEFYHREPAIDPVNTENTGFYVLRGGSWNYSERYCRSARRYQSPPDGRFFNFGFRLALVAKKET